MTISLQITGYTYIGDGTSVNFAFGAKFKNASDLKVYVNGVLLASGYSVSGADNPLGGTVTFTVAPLTGVTIYIKRSTPAVQNQAYIDNVTIFGATIEPGLDYLTVLAQDTARDAADALLQAQNTSAQLAANNVQPVELGVSGGLLSWRRVGTVTWNALVGWTITSSYISDFTAAVNALIATAIAALGSVATLAANVFTGDQTINTASGGNVISKNSTAPGVATQSSGGWLANMFSSTSVIRTFASITAVITTATNAAEAGYISIKTIVAGALTEAFRIGGGLYTPGVTGGDPGAGWINVTNGFKINNVALPTSSGGRTLIGTITATGAATAALTTGTWTGYRGLVLEVDSITLSSAVNVFLELTNDGGTTWSTGVGLSNAIAATPLRGVYTVENLQSANTSAAVISGTLFNGSTALTPAAAVTSNIAGPFNGVRWRGASGTWTAMNTRVYGVL